MDYFTSGLKSVLGTQQHGQPISGAETVGSHTETVERLVERVQSSTLLDDRRDACRALKALSKKYRVQVGALGMDALRFILELDKQDCEIVSYALDTLCNVMCPEVFEEEESSETGHEALLHVGEQFTEMFLKHPENVSLILGFLEEYDFKVRWPALKLLTTLLSNRVRDIQEIILISPMGVSKLMDMLGDSREVIRNETLLLLIHLTKGNANIQKIVAFENAFDRLFDVIAEEGYSDGGIVVEDCLLLMLNLLRNNTSNQNFFKEGSYIQRLVSMFHLPPDGAEDGGWPPQKVANLLCVLQVVRCLVSPSNPNQVTSSCQKALSTSGILEALSSILMANGVPAEALTEAICTLGEAIRGCMANQDYFSSVMAPSNPPNVAIVVLLMSMVNEKQPFILRTSVLYCFQCYLFKNEVAQAQLIQTLLPSSAEVSRITSGQLLCSGLFSHDPLSNWLSSIALSHALIENPHQKENLLRVLLAPNPNSPPVSLMAQVSVLLQQSCRVQSKVGFLILLATWLSHCQLAVKMFLEVPSNIPYLTSQAGSTERDDNEEIVQGLCAFLMGICLIFNDDSVSTYTKESLRRLIDNRVGLETFLSKLCEVSRHEFYSKASKLPQPKAQASSELLFDYEFCKLFKVLEGMVVKAVGQVATNGEISEAAMIAQYKDMIREQDKTIKGAQETIAKLMEEKNQLQTSLERITNENALLKAMSQVNSGPEGGHLELVTEIERWKEECRIRDMRINQLELDIKNLQVIQMTSEVKNVSLEDGSVEDQDSNKQVEKLLADQEDLLVLIADQEQKLTVFKERLRALGEKIEDDDDDDENEEVT